LTIKVDGRVVRCDIASKSLRKARSAIAAHGVANVVTIMQGKLVAGGVLSEAGLVAQVKPAPAA
jgi:predicted O-methyltransferase YrrM